MKMIRKQLYIEAAQEAKLKRLAASEHCTEAEIVRRAIDELHDCPVENDVVRRLREAGLLIESPGTPIPDDERRRREQEWDQIAKKIGNIGLSDAVIEDREERDAFLAGLIGNRQEVHPGRRIGRSSKPAQRA